jgi:hypothetical protein
MPEKANRLNPRAKFCNRKNRIELLQIDEDRKTLIELLNPVIVFQRIAYRGRTRSMVELQKESLRTEKIGFRSNLWRASRNPQYRRGWHDLLNIYA